MIYQSWTGERTPIRKSGEFFENGFKLIYSTGAVDDVGIRQLYKIYRNGMFHSMIPNDRCALSRELTGAFHQQGLHLTINPPKLIEDLIGHFEWYCGILNSCGDPLSQRFESFFDSFAAQSKVPDYAAPFGTTPDPSRQ